MPLLKLQVSSGSITDEKRGDLLRNLSKTVAEIIGKPEKYVMVSIEESAFLMSGEPGPAAFAELSSIGGLNLTVNNDLTKKICSLLNKSLGISSERVYVAFYDVSANDWGWNGSTFG